MTLPSNAGASRESQKDSSQVRQKEMLARHFDRLAAAPDTGEKCAYTFVPGNLTELLLSFDLLPVLPEINALQSGMRGKSAEYRDGGEARALRGRPCRRARGAVARALRS